jgi:hypothetical protein
MVRLVDVDGPCPPALTGVTVTVWARPGEPADVVVVPVTVHVVDPLVTV